MKKTNLIVILIIILLTSCGRKGDLLPPPSADYNFQEMLYIGE
ncbi:MAG: lipoprotein [Pseudomonadota bacterium]|nr:lipoprotein [Pseudomonadota bacterium]MEC9414000.1 lipoprotein [Pseudomonadota bacterium]